MSMSFQKFGTLTYFRFFFSISPRHPNFFYFGRKKGAKIKSPTLKKIFQGKKLAQKKATHPNLTKDNLTN
jgi:hypothetical protein